MIFNSTVRPMVVYLMASLLTLAACSTASNTSPTQTAVHDQPTSTVASTSVVATTPTVSPDSTESANATQDTCPPTKHGEVDSSASLELGPGSGIPSTTAEGEMLVIVGAIYTADCAPLASATLNVWQTDANGEYGPGHGTDDMRCCYLMGSLRTDSHGRYQLITNMPAHYKGESQPPPAHIHVEINHSRIGQSHTEIVFAGDPYLPTSLRGYGVVDLVSIPASATTAAHLLGVADIILD